MTRCPRFASLNAEGEKEEGILLLHICDTRDSEAPLLRGGPADLGFTVG